MNKEGTLVFLCFFSVGFLFGAFMLILSASSEHDKKVEQGKVQTAKVFAVCAALTFLLAIVLSAVLPS